MDNFTTFYQGDQSPIHVNMNLVRAYEERDDGQIQITFDKDHKIYVYAERPDKPKKLGSISIGLG